MWRFPEISFFVFFLGGSLYGSFQYVRVYIGSPFLGSYHMSRPKTEGCRMASIQLLRFVLMPTEPESKILKGGICIGDCTKGGY